MTKTENIIQSLINEGSGDLGCLMVNFDLADTIEIQKWVDENIPSSVIITPEHETHITVFYGVKNTVPIHEIKSFVDQLPYIVVKLKSVNFFKQDGQDVVKIEVESPQLQEINKRFKEYLGESNIEPSRYDYNPHVTLAYVQPNSVQHLEGHDRFNGYVYILKKMVYSEPNSSKKHVFDLSND